MKIKQITTLTEHNGIYFMYLVSENGDLLRYEKNLETGKESWIQMLVPEIETFNTSA